jgi:putative ABC transport system substrate-binding protein
VWQRLRAVAVQRIRFGAHFLAFAVLSLPLHTEAQTSSKVPRLCFLTFDPGTPQSSRFDPFFQALRDLSYVDRQTISIDYLSVTAQGKPFSALAAECLRLKADVIVVTTTPAAQAAKNATRTIPIVMAGLGDPVATGIVGSLANPGGNVTGVTIMSSQIAAKRLELLKEMVPGISRVLVLSYPVDPIAAPQVKELENAASSIGVKVLIQDILSADDLGAAFDAGVKWGAEGVLTTAASIFTVNRKRVVELAAQHKFPGLYASRETADAGGLMWYGPKNADLFRRSATYVDKVLKGAKPADLPVEQPTEFGFVINSRTAKTLGRSIPRALIMRADQIIE